MDVIGISEVTGFPEIMDGRLKTLHPNIHGGLLAVRDNEEHMAQINEHGIAPIDLVVVNLYPFKETISKEDVTYDEAIENIDIGGPGMLRAASKNHQDVTVITDPADYSSVLNEIKEHGGVSLKRKRELAAKVFRHTAAYDALIADYLTREAGEKDPEQFTVTFEKNNRSATVKTLTKRLFSIKAHSLSPVPSRRQNSFTAKSFLTTILRTRMRPFKSSGSLQNPQLLPLNI